MILEANFIQMQYVAKERYMLATAARYKTEGERQAAANAYIQGRVDTSADMETLAQQHNNMLKERNKLAAELAALKKGKAKPDEGLGL